MKALIYEQPGDVDALQYREEPDPEPGPRDVVVKVVATTINHLDVIQRKGWFAMPGFQLPHISGMDVAGTVHAIGSEVTQVREGDRVLVDPSLTEVPEGSRLAGLGDLYGDLGIIGATVNGGYAELCLAPDTHVHHIPDDVSWHYAVLFPTVWMTAHHALFDVGELQAGGKRHDSCCRQRCVHGGYSMGETPWGHGSRHCGKRGKMRACARARVPIMFARIEIATWLLGPAKSRRVAASIWFLTTLARHCGRPLSFPSRPRGRLVNCGGTTGNAPTIPSLGFFYHMGLKILGSDPYRYEEFAPAWKTYQQGNFQAVVDSVFPLSEGADAQEKLLRGDFFGKIVLEP